MYKPEFTMNGVNLWIINQLRKAINMMGITKDESAGGNAIQYYPDKRIILRDAGKLKKQEETTLGLKEVPHGCIAHMWAEKNRTERSHIPVELPIIFGKGISNVLTVTGILKVKKAAVAAGSVTKVSLFNEPMTIKGGIKGFHEWVSSNYEEIVNIMRDRGMLQLVQEEFSDEELTNSVAEYIENRNGSNEDDEESPVITIEETDVLD